MTQKTNDFLAQMLAACYSRQAEKVPANFKTREQWQKVFKRSQPHTARLLARFVTDGQMECRVFRIVSGRRGVHPVPHYRLL